MDRIDPDPREETVLTIPDPLDLCARFIAEHGDYENWSEKTRQAYQATIKHAASFGTL